MENVISELECKRCGGKWWPRSPKKPKYCSICHSPNWQTQKKTPAYLLKREQANELQE